MDWQIIVSAVIGIVLTLAGSTPFFRKLLKKLSAAGNVAKEASDVILKARAILDDNKVTAEEIAEFRVELAEVSAALKELFSKEIEEIVE